MGSTVLGSVLANTLAYAQPDVLTTSRADVALRRSPGEVQLDEGKLKDLVAFIESEVNDGTAPGAGIVATRHGRPFLEHFCGTYRTLSGEDRPFEPNVSSLLFSFSKGISATVIAMAHQDGFLDYDVPVSMYIPEFNGGGKEAITLRHLLTHSAGIPTAPVGHLATEEQWRAAMKKVCTAPLEWPVGSKTIYHGISAMFVAAEAVRRVSGNKPWDAICRDLLFDPIGATSLTFDTPAPGKPVALTPSYFQSLDAAKYDILRQPAGGCFGTLEDMLRVLNLIVDGGRWHARQLIEPDALKEMLTVQYANEIARAVREGKNPVHDPWGLGWLIRGTGPQPGAAGWFGFGDSPSPTLFGHAGVNTVFGVGDPARGLAFAFITTDSPGDEVKSTRLRTEVSNRLQEAVDDKA
jgi:CubicO group peptidase (beta-lactamase class C family)